MILAGILELVKGKSRAFSKVAIGLCLFEELWSATDMKIHLVIR